MTTFNKQAISEPLWVAEARKYIGQREIKGVTHNPLILAWWKAIKRGGIKDDETPWCAAFVGAMLEASGIVSSRFESAKSYLTWGSPLQAPIAGCIVVFSRDGGGHVGFVVGTDTKNNLLVLGGNQSDGVNVRAFARANVAGYRWPTAVPLQFYPLPVATAEIANRVT
jgi:uncharacterized protein (TIGR02594 family)